jgi:FKBP-type peptidyl-prolyl cis-trans isomerase FkpA
MKKIILFATGLFLVSNVEAQVKKTTSAKAPVKKSTTAPKTAAGFTKLPSGVSYKLVKDVPGKNAIVSDFAEVHISTKIGDSVLFDSRKMNNNNPVPLQIQKPQFSGDVVEGFTYMSVGDSAIFTVAIDSIKKRGAQLAPWMKDGMMLEYYVQMVSIKSEAQTKADNEKKSSAQKTIDATLIEDYLKKNNIAAQKSASGLNYVITNPGSGENAKAGQSVTVNYTGTTLDGKKFDSNVDSSFNHVQPFTFTLGQGQVIKGWDEGIALLKKGGKAKLFIPSHIAYGAQSPSPAIPANSVLVFEVEVVNIENAK